jgi:hypothetical protein
VVTVARAFLARILAVLACLILPVALTSAWMAAVVTDTDTYVDTVTPLAKDPAVQKAAERRLEQATITRIESVTGLEVPPYARQVVRATVAAVVAGPLFEQTWREANRTAHQEAIALLEGHAAPLTSERNGQVTLELGSVLGAVLTEIANTGLIPASAATFDASFRLMSSDTLRKAQDAYALLDAAGYWLPVLWVVVAVAAGVLAPRRRGVLRWLGWGSFATSLLLLVTVFVARAVAVHQAPTTVDGDLLGAVWDVVVRGLLVAIGVTAGASLVVAVGTHVGRQRPAPIS